MSSCVACASQFHMDSTFSSRHGRGLVRAVITAGPQHMNLHGMMTHLVSPWMTTESASMHGSPD